MDPQSRSLGRTTVVIPVYFNAGSIGRVVADVEQAWVDSGRKSDALEFVLVDDGSTDNSWEAILAIHAADPKRILAVRLACNHGSQLAILAGAKFARGEFVAMVAADGQEPPELVWRMAELAERGERVVLAVRHSRADSAGTRVSAGFFYRLVRILGLKAMPESGFDAFLVDHSLMKMILDIRDPNIPLSVTIAWLGFQYGTVEYDRLARTDGQSRWTFQKKVKLALDAITAVSYAPIRIISLLGVLMAVAGFLYSLFIIIDQLFFGFPVQGWASLFVAVLVLGGTQLLAMGIIGEYLWRTLEVVRMRPLWRIEATRGFVEDNREIQP